ncbi:hypothetical protein ACFX13_013712 [Malus domestica]
MIEQRKRQHYKGSDRCWICGRGDDHSSYGRKGVGWQGFPSIVAEGRGIGIACDGGVVARKRRCAAHGRNPFDKMPKQNLQGRGRE